jgi:hypothetical protein
LVACHWAIQVTLVDGSAHATVRIMTHRVVFAAGQPRATFLFLLRLS